MNEFSKFKMSDMIELGSKLRRLGQGAKSLEETAQRIVHSLFDSLILGTAPGEKAFTLVRFFKTHSYGNLPAELQKSASGILGNHPASPEMKCLTLLATVGENPAWNSRKDSTGHKAIPLPSEKIVVQFPMISQLVNQFGLKVSEILKPTPDLIMELEQKAYNVFHVPTALGSPFIPAQDNFVVPYKVKSVLGFGGMFPSGDLFAIIMFGKVPVSHESAELFKTLALSVKMAVLPFINGVIFS
ncbi:MAG: hypothetical protein HQM08_07405 [Candidatus Riflebacteria bacterium]|nr:hypothetical protein [Candidatus Riflebacteria bacterium]